MTVLATVQDPTTSLDAPRLHAAGLLGRLTGLVIVTQAEAQEGAILLREIKTRSKALKDTRMGITRPIDAAKQKVMDLFRPIEEMYQEAESRLAGALAGFDAEQRRIAQAEAEARRAAELEIARQEAARIEAERKAREAELAAERDAARKLAQAEAARIEAERLAAMAQAKTAAEKIAAEAAAKAAREAADAEGDRLAREQEAAVLEAEWAADEAAEAAAELEAAPLEIEAAPKLTGFHTRKDWKIEVIDITLLAGAVGAGTVPPGVLEPVTSALKALVKAGFTQIPGCLITQVDVPVSR